MSSRRSSRQAVNTVHTPSTASNSSKSSARKRSSSAVLNSQISRKKIAGVDVKPYRKIEKHPARDDIRAVLDTEDRLAGKKWQSWSQHADASPYPDFPYPTNNQCHTAHKILKKLHQADVDKEFSDPNTPETIPYVLDAMIVAVLSQATSWSNAKRAMNSMKNVYGSVFNYDAIYDGGIEKLQDTIRCGGLHVRKSKLLMAILDQVKTRYQKWSLDHLFEVSDEEAMKELMSYKGMGPKSASVVLSWSLKRNPFTVDTHVYRIAGLWEWRPQEATRELTQSHLNAVTPDELKFDLHFLLIAHGRSCPVCRGGSKSKETCPVLSQINEER